MTNATAENTAPMHQRTPEAADARGALCRQCRGPFERKAAWQHFCSEPCRREWHKVNKGKRIRLIDLERRIADLEARLERVEHAPAIESDLP